MSRQVKIHIIHYYGIEYAKTVCGLWMESEDTCSDMLAELATCKNCKKIHKIHKKFFK